MTPQQRLAQAFMLTERTRELFRAGLRRRFPDLDDVAFQKLYVRMMQRCHERKDKDEIAIGRAVSRALKNN